jgi:hypothetical protein
MRRLVLVSAILSLIAFLHVNTAKAANYQIPITFTNSFTASLGFIGQYYWTDPIDLSFAKSGDVIDFGAVVIGSLGLRDGAGCPPPSPGGVCVLVGAVETGIYLPASEITNPNELPFGGSYGSSGLRCNTADPWCPTSTIIPLLYTVGAERQIQIATCCVLPIYTAPIPVPAALPLFATGLVALAYAGRRKRRAAQAAA